MTRTELATKFELTHIVRYSWGKVYDNGTRLQEYAIYYNNRARKPLAWLQIWFYMATDNVISAGITINDAERTEIEIENINDIEKIVNKYLSLK
jgi:hypothetical protein